MVYEYSGSVSVVMRLLEYTHMSVGDFDAVEANGAFAAEAPAVVQDLDLSMDKTHPIAGVSSWDILSMQPC